MSTPRRTSPRRSPAARRFERRRQRLNAGTRRPKARPDSGTSAARAAGHDHHHVYVVELDPAVGRLPEVRAANPDRQPDRPCVYVGMTGLAPEERLLNHREGWKASRYVQRYGRRLLPELYEFLNPLPYAAACEMERDLAADLRRQGYTVTGGH